MMLAQLGPDASTPRGCDRLQWRWLSGGEGWLSCRDRRNFVIAAGGVSVDRGRLPKHCANGMGALVRRGDSLFATCDEGEIWRCTGTRWERVPAPKVEAIAMGGQCLYAVSRKVVWRNCSLP